MVLISSSVFYHTSVMHLTNPENFFLTPYNPCHTFGVNKGDMATISLRRIIILIVGIAVAILTGMFTGLFGMSVL